MDNASEFGKIKKAFAKIKEEMDDHLTAINENTEELNSQSLDVRRIEEILEKLSERIDNIELRMPGALSAKNTYDTLSLISLTHDEKEVFSLLYRSKGDLLDNKKIATAIGITEESARSLVESLLAKGIPVIKKYFDSKTFLVLDSDFVDLQAKVGIIKF